MVAVKNGLPPDYLIIIKMKIKTNKFEVYRKNHPNYLVAWGKTLIFVHYKLQNAQCRACAIETTHNLLTHLLT